MVDINKHKFFLVSVLKDIYKDTILAATLGFKGGTAHMLFYGLPRFSVDLDFNLLQKETSDDVFKKLKSILLKYGTIKDEAEKYHGILFVLNYGENERNLKVEVSNREFPDHYEIKNFLGIPMLVMQKPDMFAHKLCALLNRKLFTNRDLFDIYFYLKDKTPLNKEIVEMRSKINLTDYLTACIDRIEKISPNSILNGIGELLGDELKTFVKNELKNETIQLLKIYRQFPILA